MEDTSGYYEGLRVSGGVASNLHCLAGGRADVYSGGRVETALLEGQYVSWTSGGSNLVSGIYGKLNVSDGGVAVDVSCGSVGGLMIYSGGYASDVVMSSGGAVDVYAGGSADSIELKEPSMLTVYGAVQDVYCHNRAQIFLFNGTINSAVVEDTSGYYEGLRVSGGVANEIIVKSGGQVQVSSGGVVNGMTMSGYYKSSGDSIDAMAYVEDGGSASGVLVNRCAKLYVSDGAKLSNAIISGWGGNVYILSGASADGIGLAYGGTLIVSNGGHVENLSYLVNEYVALEGYVTGGDSKTYIQGVNPFGKEFTVQNGVGSNLVLYSHHSAGGINVMAGGIVKDTVVSGYLYISSGGLASNTTNYRGIHIYSGGTAKDTTVNSGGLYIMTGAIAEDTTVNSNGSLINYGGGIIKGKLVLGGTLVNSRTLDATSATIDFAINQRKTTDTVIIDDMSKINGATYSIKVSSDQAGGTYKLAGNASAFNQSITVCTTEGTCFGSITVGDSLCVDAYTCYSLARTDDGALTFSVILKDIPAPKNPVGNNARLQWSEVEDVSSYIVEYSQDNFATCIKVETETVGMEHYNVGAGTWQWRVKAKKGHEWAVGNNVVVSDTRAETNVVVATADGVKDVFFVKAIGSWDSTYRARHMGVNGVWEGTGEKVVFGGENRFGDIFQGARDENVLLLTDDANGDALFVYDTFTESKDGMAKSQSRLSNIKEICAGAGNDIVDLTSDKFDYTGGGLSIHGGLGDDTIWANAGNNTLFGDAGNDRLVGANGNDVIVGGLGNDSMHGGGGNDVFAYGDYAWGQDTIEQLPGGDLLLWFEDGMKLGGAEGDIQLTSDADGNAVLKRVGTSDKVTVKGYTQAEVVDRLVFGSGTYNGQNYGELSAMGVFSPATTERVFEERTRGQLA